jgi:hypothetical protein
VALQTVIFAIKVSTNASSSARAFKTSPSAERLINIVNAFFEMGWLNAAR